MLTESQIKHTCEIYLDTLKSMGELMWFRLNSGEWLVQHGSVRYKIQGCPKGTADCLIIKRNAHTMQFPWVIFVEYKKETGKMSAAQKIFETDITNMGPIYKVVRSFDELKELLDSIK